MFAQRPAERSPLLTNRPDDFDAWTASGTDDADETMEWGHHDAARQQRRGTAAVAARRHQAGDPARTHRLPDAADPGARDDRVMPDSYAARIADAIAGPATVATIPGAGHMAEFRPPRRGGRRR